MERSIIITKDGSHTIAIPEMQVTYHSHHGAIQESLHVFIRAGLQPITPRHDAIIRIFEMGFGTGLNALLTLTETEQTQQHIHYTTVEKFPLSITEVAGLNYCQQLNRPDLQTVFEKMHECEWEKEIPVTNRFTLKKCQTNLIELVIQQPVHLVYFDAFAPTAQPELWTKEIFEHVYSWMEPGGILVTYCSKGDVRRAMQAAGFRIEKLTGPPGKREMVRATKPVD